MRPSAKMVFASRGLKRRSTGEGFCVGTESSRHGFTLIEIMVAVGIMAVLLSIGIPTLYTNMHQDSMRKAVNDVMEVCGNVRARAILDGTTMELRIRPAEGSFSMGAVAAVDHSGEREGGLSERVNYQWGDRMRDHPAPSGGGNVGGLSVKLSPSIRIEGLGVSGEDWTEDEEAHVWFYSNGTCDEMSLVLLSDKGERRNIFLEVVTGLAEFEVDPLKFRDR